MDWLAGIRRAAGATCARTQAEAVGDPFAELRRKFSVSAAETISHSLYRRAGIGVAVLSGDPQPRRRCLDNARRLVAAHPEFELLSVRGATFH